MSAKYTVTLSSHDQVSYKILVHVHIFLSTSVMHIVDMYMYMYRICEAQSNPSPSPEVSSRKRYKKEMDSYIHMYIFICQCAKQMYICIQAYHGHEKTYLYMYLVHGKTCVQHTSQKNSERKPLTIPYKTDKLICVPTELQRQLRLGGLKAHIHVQYKVTKARHHKPDKQVTSNLV